MSTLSGHLIIKNGIKYDYSFIESCESVLPICDEFIVIEGSGDDGTYEALLEWQQKNDKVKIFRADWSKFHYEVLADMTNIAIEKCSCKYHLQIQADECLHEKYHDRIRAILADDFDYVNFGVYHFFGNFNQIYAPGVFYDSFIRMGKRSLYPKLRSVGDAMSLGMPENDSAKFKSKRMMDVKFHHYGYVRKPKALIEKQADVTRWWGYQGYADLDPFLKHGLENGKIDWLEKQPQSNLLPYTDTHPAVLEKWISDRSYLVQEGIVE